MHPLSSPLLPSPPALTPPSYYATANAHPPVFLISKRTSFKNLRIVSSYSVQSCPPACPFSCAWGLSPAPMTEGEVREEEWGVMRFRGKGFELEVGEEASFSEEGGGGRSSTSSSCCRVGCVRGRSGRSGRRQSRVSYCGLRPGPPHGA